MAHKQSRIANPITAYKSYATISIENSNPAEKFGFSTHATDDHSIH